MVLPKLQRDKKRLRVEKIKNFPLDDNDIVADADWR
jgi:hypothetical protein